jgi:anti-anti-sigma factor
VSDSSRAPILALRTVEEGRRAVVYATGELDMSGRPMVAALAERLAGRFDEVVLDLHELDFIDSSGMSALVQFEAAVRARTRLRSPSRPVARALQITGLDKVFTIEL